MREWTALVPFRTGPQGKSRLAPIYSADERQRLSLAMAERVLTALAQVTAITDIVVMGPESGPQLPVRHFPDLGRGLNTELDKAAAAIRTPLLVIHADLPTVEAADIELLLTQAHAGAAIAPDRHRCGTNALALLQVPPAFRFSFGLDSCNRHAQSLGALAPIVWADGLALDVDTADDLDLARAAGFSWPCS